jgi:hypothetical protein
MNAVSRTQRAGRAAIVGRVVVARFIADARA